MLKNSPPWMAGTRHISANGLHLRRPTAYRKPLMPGTLWVG